jgi:hypothetical protein
MKKGLLIVAAVAMLAGIAQAGEIKLHDWPTAFVAQELMTIPVKMDVGYWIRVKSQTKYSIKLVQVGSSASYNGCVDIPVECNFTAALSTVIAAVTTNGDVSGKWSSDVTPTTISKPGQTISVCAHLTEANLINLTGGADAVQVATVTLKVVPGV